MDIKSDWKGTEIIYVEGVGYKILIDMGNFQYVLDTPEDITLSDLSDYSDMRDNPKHTDELEVMARLQYLGPNAIMSKDKFEKGYYNSDILVSVPMDVFVIGGNAYETAKNFLEEIETAKEETVNKLYHDPEYIRELGGYLLRNNGDLEDALDQFENTGTYGAILERLQLTQDQVDKFNMVDTDPVQYRKNYQLYFDSFKRTAKKQYGDVLPDSVLGFLADKTRSGYFTEKEAVDQIQGIFDPYSGITVHKGIISLLDGEDIQYTTTMESEAQTLLDTYLPSHLQGEYDVSYIAGQMRNDATFQNQFIEELKDKRYSSYDMYDRNINWASIIANKQTLANNILGIQLESDDPLLDEIVKLNDYSKETERLREYGLQTGNNKVRTDIADAMFKTFGQGIASSRSYVG